MDEKTATLREIFIEATGDETVTERQAESPGAITESDREGTADRLAELVDAMGDRYAFATDLDAAGYERVVRGFFDGESDEAIAAEVGVAEETVFRARLDLHLVAETDRDGPVDLNELKRLSAEGVPTEDRAARVEADVDPETVRRYAAVADADVASTRVNHRFRDAFERLLTDADLGADHAADVHDDGLREAAEDIETNVSF